MTRENLNRLKEVLSVPSHSRDEVRMIEYLKSVFDVKGYEYYTDKIGNIYVTKGETEFFPCFVAHTDTVHKINENMRVVQLEEGGDTILTGIDIETMKPSGIGGDDKCGVYLCLEMLDKLENVKVALFVSEEIGCVGSRQADPKFFENVGYAIQYDSPKGDSMSMTLMGKKLFGKTTDFGKKVSPLILEHGITDWATHPYTDIWPLMDKFGFSCLNLAAGYYNYHTDNEYVLVSDVDNAFELGIELHEALGENFYERPKDVEPKQYGRGGYGRGRGGYGRHSYQRYEQDYEEDYEDVKDVILLSEGVDDLDNDILDDLTSSDTRNVEGVIYSDSGDFTDEWEDFNKNDYGDRVTKVERNESGGLIIEHIGDLNDLDTVSKAYPFEW